MKYEQYRGYSLIPPGIRSTKNWIATGMVGGKRAEFSCGTASIEGAKTFIDRLINHETPYAADPEHYPVPGEGLPAWARKLMAAARCRAAGAGVPFTLTAEDMRAVITRAGGHCEVSGIPFSTARPAGARRRPYAASLDRISPALGYVPGNCRLVLFALNVAMSDWGEVVVRHIARHLVGRNVGIGRIDEQKQSNAA